MRATDAKTLDTYFESIKFHSSPLISVLHNSIPFVPFIRKRKQKKKIGFDIDLRYTSAACDVHGKIQLSFCAYIFFEFVRIVFTATHWIEVDIFSFFFCIRRFNELHLFPYTIWLNYFISQAPRLCHFTSTVNLFCNILAFTRDAYVQTFILFACEDTFMTARITTTAGVYIRRELWTLKTKEYKK